MSNAKNKIIILAATILVALHGTGGNADDGTSALPLPDNVVHQVILDYPKHPDPNFTFAAATRICAQNKQFEGMDYFYVICKIIETEKEEKVFEFVERPDFKFMGYSVTNTYDYWGYLFSTESPVYEKIFIRKEELKEKLKRKMHRIIIWGVGDLHNSPKKLLYSSVEAGDGDYPVYFESAAEAKSECGKILDERKLKNRNGVVYDGAKCEPLQNPKNEKFYFDIYTQSPLVQGKGIVP